VGRRIVHVYPLSQGGGIELLVGGNQRQPAQAMGGAISMQIRRRSQLQIDERSLASAPLADNTL
jgi:hypothetical protein